MNKVIISGQRGANVAQKMAQRLEVSILALRRHIFADGNLWVRVDEPVADKEVIIVQSLWGEWLHQDIIELIFVVDALQRAGAAKITVIFPYFSYAKADKTDGAGTSLRAQVMAKILDGMNVNEIRFLELHNKKILQYFETKTKNISAMKLWSKYLQTLIEKQKEEYILVSPDEGGANVAQKLAQILALPYSFCRKTRPQLDGAPQIMSFEGEVAGKQVIIIDDFTTTGGTLLAAAKTIRARGAKSVRAIVTHAPVTISAAAKLQGSKSIDGIATTNTTGIKLPENFDKWEIIDCSSLLY